MFDIINMKIDLDMIEFAGDKRYVYAQLGAKIKIDELYPIATLDKRFLAALEHEFRGSGSRPRVERIIANGPATIVFWDDGEKTVVKCRECEMCDATKAPTPSCVIRYDHEKAVMAAMLKRLAPGWQDDVRKAEKEVR